MFITIHCKCGLFRCVYFNLSLNIFSGSHHLTVVSLILWPVLCWVCVVLAGLCSTASHSQSELGNALFPQFFWGSLCANDQSVRSYGKHQDPRAVCSTSASAASFATSAFSQCLIHTKLGVVELLLTIAFFLFLFLSCTANWSSACSACKMKSMVCTDMVFNEMQLILTLAATSGFMYPRKCSFRWTQKTNAAPIAPLHRPLWWSNAAVPLLLMIKVD